MATAFILSGCQNSSRDTVVANVGEYEITKSEFEFYLQGIKQQMQGTELSTEEDWHTKEIDGKLAIEVAKEEALNNALYNIAYIEIYKNMGHKIGAEEKKAIKETKDNIVAEYEQNGGYEEFLKTQGITDEFVDLLCESIYCSDQLYAEFTQGKDVSDERVNQHFEENADELAKYRTAKHVLISTQNIETGEAYDDAKKAEAKQKADEILKKAKNGEDFDALVNQYSEDPGSKTSPNGYTFGDGEMVQEFQDCVDSLKPGEIGFCQSSFGYHIVKRVELDKSVFVENVKQFLLTEEFNKYIDEKCAEYAITIEANDLINDIGMSDSSKEQTVE